MPRQDEKSTRAIAKSIWRSMNESQKHGVRFGLFPAPVMAAAEAQGHNGRELAVALMEEAKADGGMRA